MGDIIVLGNNFDEVAKVKRARRRITNLLLSNGCEPILDEKGEATGDWNMPSFRIMVHFSEKAMYSYIVQYMNFLRDNCWKDDLDIHGNYVWTNACWQILEPVSTGEALKITNMKLLGVKKEEEKQ
jgi:hypothetical protein